MIGANPEEKTSSPLRGFNEEVVQEEQPKPSEEEMFVDFN